MNKHNACDLVQMQSLPLKYKIIMTKQRIKAWYDYWDGNVYVSISGGKDSQVLAHIVKEMYPDVPLVFVNTGLEFDSVRLKGMELADEVLRPSMDFVSVITKYGYPVISKEVAQTLYECQNRKIKGLDAPTYRMEKLNGTLIDKNNGKLSSYNIPQYKFLLDAPFRISHKCCDVMKKIPCKSYEKTTNRKPFLGIMAEESRLRKQKWIQHGCNAFNEKRPTSQPLSFWTEQDILHYINQNNIDIAEIYGDIVYTDEDGMLYDNKLFKEVMPLTTTKAKRTGCVFCMFGITQDTERFLILKEEEPNKYDFVMNGGRFFYTVLDKNKTEIKLSHCKRESIVNWCENNMNNPNFTITKEWKPYKGLGYKFVIDWLNEHGGFDIKY